MNIQTVANNLRNTIASKEQMLAHMNENCGYASTGQVMAHNATVEFLKVNIDELKRILQDVEKCCEIETSRSWEGCVDRMSGAFDESELCGRHGWI